jgi:hypothetical protein
VPRLELVERSLKQQPPAIDDPNLVGDLFDFAEQMTRQKHSDAVFARQVEQQCATFVHSSRIEAMGRIVEDDHLGLMHQRQRQSESLSHPHRVLAHKAVCGSGQFHDRQRAFDSEPIRCG